MTNTVARACCSREETPVLALGSNSVKLPFPLLHVLSAVSWMVGVTGFFSTMAFLSAKPVVLGKVDGHPVPLDWQAAVVDHGVYCQWHLAGERPLWLAASVLALIVFCVASLPLAKAIRDAQGLDQTWGGWHIASPTALPWRRLVRLCGIWSCISTVAYSIACDWHRAWAFSALASRS